MSYLSEVRQQALAEAGAWVAESFPRARLISHNDLTKAAESGSAAVWGPLDVGDSHAVLYLELDQRFPFSLPRVRLAEVSDARLRSPHIERDGRLCLAGSDAAFDANRVTDIISHQLREAESLLADNITGVNESDFYEDFSRYWLHSITSTKIVYDLMPTSFAENEFFSFNGKSSVLAQTASECKRWLNWRFGSKPERIRTGLHLKLNTLPAPRNYPADGATCRDLVKHYASDDLPRFDNFARCLVVEGRDGFVLFSAISPSGEPLRFGGLLVIPPAKGGRMRQNSPITRGFKSIDKMPGQVLANRLKFDRLNLTKPRSWKSRHLEEHGRLGDHRILVFGCGSVGSEVARQLHQSGVRKMDLVDPERLGWENIGRHVLGAKSVGESKSEALADHLRSKIEPCETIKGHNEDAFSYLKRMSSDDSDSYSLAICTTGNWASEQLISQLLSAGELPFPVIFGWLEPFGQAAHALLLDSESPCFKCGFDEFGNSVLPVSVWADQEGGGCNDNVSIYSSIAAAPSHSLISSLALDALLGRVEAPVHRVWVGMKDEIARLGGHINPAWERAHRPLELGQCIVPVPWAANPECQCQA